MIESIHDVTLILAGTDDPRGVPDRRGPRRGRQVPPRPQPPGVRLPDRLRPTVQPLPGPAAPGGLRRTPELRRYTVEHRHNPPRGVRSPPTDGLRSSDTHS